MKKTLLFGLALTLAQVACNASANENLVVFVGEKISVEKFDPKTDPKTILMDEAFMARYHVLDVVYGDYKQGTIAFEAYDHYGRPHFEKFKNVLLFVSRDGERLYHQKYQYFPIFKTLSGRWAGCGASNQFDGPAAKVGEVKAREIDFAPDAFFDVSGMDRADIDRLYPAQYYRLKDGKAYCLQGNYVSELFEVKKQGVLKARGLFKDTANRSSQ